MSKGAQRTVRVAEILAAAASLLFADRALPGSWRAR